MRLLRGSVHDGIWKQQCVLGIAHYACFATAVESPKLVLDELRRTTRDAPADPTAA